MPKRKPIILKVGAQKLVAEACNCSIMTVWRAQHWNADTFKENEIRDYINNNKYLLKKF